MTIGKILLKNKRKNEEKSQLRRQKTFLIFFSYLKMKKRQEKSTKTVVSENEFSGNNILILVLQIV